VVHSDDVVITVMNLTDDSMLTFTFSFRWKIWIHSDMF